MQMGFRGIKHTLLVLSLLALSAGSVLGQEEVEAATEAGGTDGFTIVMLLAGVGAVVAVGVLMLRSEQERA